MRTLAQPARAGKHFSLFAVLGGNGDPVQHTRVGHVPGAIGAFLSQFPEGTPVALETVGHWYCLHCAAGTRGSSTRSRKPAEFLCSLMPPRPRS
jgi:hypothetical protein